MRSWGLGCACGAWARGSRKAVNRWASNHECQSDDEYRDVSGSLLENTARMEADGMEARIGFQRETW